MKKNSQETNWDFACPRKIGSFTLSYVPVVLKLITALSSKSKAGTPFFITAINSSQELNVKNKIIKLLEEKHR